MDAGANQPLRGSNLKLEGQNSRLRMGLAGLVVALGIAVWLVGSEVDRTWRLLLFFPFFFAAMGAWQGLYRTCPGNVSKGICEEGGGKTKRVISSDEIAAARCLARCVVIGAAVTSVIATLLVVVVP